MRGILRKLDQGQKLGKDEYQRLMEYIEELRDKSPESYMLFYERYALLLYQDYSTYLPRFAQGIDHLLNLLMEKPELLPKLKEHQLAMELFPPELHPYLQYSFTQPADSLSLSILFNFLDNNQELVNQLPAARKNEVVCKFEEGNPYKEVGLKAHFDRLSRYSFITRLQSYRYLSAGKAVSDRIEFVAADRLGGIFTNREKSIYYFIFLSEANEIKARNACSLLNMVFYGGKG